MGLSSERQSARMSEIKNVGYTWMAKCNPLTPLPFEGLKQLFIQHVILLADTVDTCQRSPTRRVLDFLFQNERELLYS